MSDRRMFPEAFTAPPSGQVGQRILVPYVEGNMAQNNNGLVYRPVFEGGQVVHRAYQQGAVVYRPVAVTAHVAAPAAPARPPGGPYVWPQGYPAPIPAAAYYAYTRPPPPPPPPPRPPTPPGRLVQAPAPMRYQDAIAHGHALQAAAASTVPIASRVPTFPARPEQFYGQDRLVRESMSVAMREYLDRRAGAVHRYFTNN